MSRGATIAALATMCVVTAGCSLLPGGSNDADDTSTTLPQVLQAPVSASGFCEQMLSIRDDALNPDDTISTADLLRRYQAVLAVAPAEVTPDLELLIEEVRSGATVEDTAAVEGDAGLDLPGEMWTPDDTASGRVFDYVDTVCAGTSSNPGPAASVPE